MVDVVTCISSLVFEKFFVCADSQQSLLSNQMPNTGFFWQKETESLKMDDIFEFKTQRYEIVDTIDKVQTKTLVFWIIDEAW